MLYPISDIYGCVQGEGCNTGLPMVMLRLQGCAVGCPWCDTKHTWDLFTQNERPGIAEVLGATPLYTYKTELEITYYISHQYPAFKWVLISGGEPAQYTLQPLVLFLQKAGYKVALETSGTETGHVGAGFDWVCISPKINMPGGKQIKPEAFFECHEIKHVVGKEADIEALDSLLTRVQPFMRGKPQICLQPVSQSQKATELCIKTVQERGTFRLSVQTHKFLNLA